MSVGAGGDALRRIEAALAVDDPALVDSFHRWGVSGDPGDGGVTIIGRRTGLWLLFGLAAVVVGPAGAVVLLLVAGTLLVCLAATRWMERHPARPAEG